MMRTVYGYFEAVDRRDHVVSNNSELYLGRSQCKFVDSLYYSRKKKRETEKDEESALDADGVEDDVVSK